MGKKVQHQQEVERRERAATKLQAINRGAKSRQLVKEKVGRVGTYGGTHIHVSAFVGTALNLLAEAAARPRAA